MANLKEVKTRIGSVSSTQQITKAMKMVAAAKLRRAQDRMVQMRPYSEKLSGILSNVSATLTAEASSEYATERTVKNVLLIVITSDRGLCGGFNSNAIKAAVALTEGKYASNSVSVLAVGNKAYEFFKKRNFKLAGEEFHDLFSRLSFDNVKLAAEFTMNSFVDGTYDAVEIVYNDFKNVATQIVRAEQYLPIAQGGSEEGDTNLDYIFEPSKEEIVTELIPKTLKITFYKALLESNASEQGARMTAMDKATENAGDLLKALKLTYNRTRQAAITKEILEIVGGAEALGG